MSSRIQDPLEGLLPLRMRYAKRTRCHRRPCCQRHRPPLPSVRLRSPSFALSRILSTLPRHCR
eukprot:6083452-Pleurochrysis_carterae.AAC.1